MTTSVAAALSKRTDRPRRCRRLVSATAAATTLALGVGVLGTGAVETAHAGPVYQVVNTGGVGVRLRNSPALNDIKGNGPLEGASFELICQAWGEAVGARSNRVWDYIAWNGQRGYIPDVYANTPTVANQFVPGMPECTAAPSTPAAPVSAVTGDTLQPGQTIQNGQSITSSDGRFRLVMQSDGNAVVYQTNTVIWSSGTYGYTGARLTMQTDGNLVVYDTSNRARWASNTAGRGGARLVMQSDANLVVYQSSTPVWASNTARSSTTSQRTSTGPTSYATGGRGAAGSWPIPAVSTPVPGCPSIAVDPTKVQPATGIPLNYTGPLYVETYSVNGCFLAARSAAGYANVGRASNAAHRWGGGYTQDFDRGVWGWNAIMQGDAVGRAFVVRSGMWSAYRTRDGINQLGYPLGNEYSIANGSAQLFERGMILWTASRGAVLVTNRTPNSGGSEMTKVPCDFEYTSRGYAGRNCTDYVAWRMASDGHPVPYGVGDAKSWSTSLAVSLGWQTDSTPRPGDIAWSNAGKYGHVAYVRSVNADGSLEIEEWNRVRCQYSTVSRVSPTNFTGFIHPDW